MNIKIILPSSQTILICVEKGEDIQRVKEKIKDYSCDFDCEELIDCFGVKDVDVKSVMLFPVEQFELTEEITNEDFKTKFNKYSEGGSLMDQPTLHLRFVGGDLFSEDKVYASMAKRENGKEYRKDFKFEKAEEFSFGNVSPSKSADLFGSEISLSFGDNFVVKKVDEKEVEDHLFPVPYFSSFKNISGKGHEDQERKHGKEDPYQACNLFENFKDFDAIFGTNMAFEPESDSTRRATSSSDRRVSEEVTSGEPLLSTDGNTSILPEEDELTPSLIPDQPYHIPRDDEQTRFNENEYCEHLKIRTKFRLTEIERKFYSNKPKDKTSKFFVGEKTTFDQDLKVGEEIGPGRKLISICNTMDYLHHPMIAIGFKKGIYIFKTFDFHFFFLFGSHPPCDPSDTTDYQFPGNKIVNLQEIFKEPKIMIRYPLEVKFVTRGRTLYVRNVDGVYIFEVSCQKPKRMITVKLIHKFLGKYTQFDITSSGRCAFIDTGGRLNFVLDLKTWKRNCQTKPFRILNKYDDITSFSFSPHGEKIIVGTRRGDLILCNLSGMDIASIFRMKSPIYNLCWPENNILICWTTSSEGHECDGTCGKENLVLCVANFSDIRGTSTFESKLFEFVKIDWSTSCGIPPAVDLHHLDHWNSIFITSESSNRLEILEERNDIWARNKRWLPVRNTSESVFSQDRKLEYFSDYACYGSRICCGSDIDYSQRIPIGSHPVTPVTPYIVFLDFSGSIRMKKIDTNNSIDGSGPNREYDPMSSHINYSVEESYNNNWRSVYAGQVAVGEERKAYVDRRWKEIIDYMKFQPLIISRCMGEDVDLEERVRFLIFEEGSSSSADFLGGRKTPKEGEKEYTSTIEKVNKEKSSVGLFSEKEFWFFDLKFTGSGVVFKSLFKSFFCL